MMHSSVLAAALLLLLCTAADGASAALKHLLPPVDPDYKLFSRMAGLVVPYGYPLEEHFVETVDGYILRMFRIPHGRSHPPPAPADQRGPQGIRQAESTQHHHAAAVDSQNWRRQLQIAPGRTNKHVLRPSAAGKPTHTQTATTDYANLVAQRLDASSSSASSSSKPVVHIQHGLLGSSTDFVLNGPDNSLPFLLADAGFDVWFGNVRGNMFSRNHTVLDLLDAEFWQFSWDEMAARDLPAMLTHELMVTGAAHISYIGHSQGTTIGMAFLSSHAGSALAEHIKVAVLLAPVAFVTHMDSLPMNALAALDTDEIFTLLGFHEFMPSSEILSKLEGQMCKAQPYLCVNLLSVVCGYNPENLDIERLPIYLNYTPSGTSVKNMAKWAQAVRATTPDELHMFDYGTQCRSYFDLPRPCNQAVYGQDTPPVYNLSAITTPLVVFTGGQDILADPEDTVILLRHLPKVLGHHHEPKYGHLDFIWGYNAGSRVYDRVLRVLKDVVSS